MSTLNSIGTGIVMKVALLLLTILLPLTILSCTSPLADTKENITLILGIHPYLPQNELIKRFTPLADYLGNQINKKVKIVITDTYDEQIELMGKDEIDIA